MNHLFLILIGVVFNTDAQLLLKVGMSRIGHFEVSMANLVPIGSQIATSLPIISGLSCYVFSVLVWLVVLSRVEVSMAYPMMSLGYILTGMVAYAWLGEALGPMRLAGMVVIMIGVWMVSRT
jgi:multidrug transporter EmrE-like cation transporter